MSPGAFWGRPGAGVNPYAAVGAPIHVQHQWVQQGSPLREDTGGYFPPVPPQEYFPFVPPSSSGLANEVVPDGESSAGDTDVSVKESSGSGLIQPGSEGELPILTRADAPRKESSDSLLRMEGSPIHDPGSQVIALDNLTIGPARRAWTSDSKTGAQGETASKGRTQASLPVELDGKSGSAGCSSSSTPSPYPVLRAGSDPVQTLSKALSTLPPAQGSGQERRASFAEVVSEGNSPGTLARKKVIITDGANSS